MADPFSIGATVVELIGEPLANRIKEWLKGEEPDRLVKLLRKNHPAAAKMIYQPEVQRELGFYATTGELRRDRLIKALSAITSDDEAARLADAIRTAMWQVVRDDRALHFELLVLRSEMRADRAGEHSARREERAAEQADLLAHLDAAIARVARRLPVARNLPAETDQFVDRAAELAAAARHLDTPSGGAHAVILACDGMPGVGKSVFARHVAHTAAERFPHGVLYADFRRANGTTRPAEEVAAQLLRDLGVSADAIPVDGQERAALVRSVLADLPVLLLLDNAPAAAEVSALVPINRESVVIVTATASLAELGAAELITLGPFADEDALAVLRSFAGARVDREPDAALAVISACDRLPLALALAGAKLRRRATLSVTELAQELADERLRLRALGDRDSPLDASFAIAVSAISDSARRLFLLIGALDVSDIEASLAAALLDATKHGAGRVLDELADQQLVLPSAGSLYRMPDLVRIYAHDTAREQLDRSDVASAQERRVKWLVEAAEERNRDTTAEE